ncbi:hypothetical protein [Streptomyces erythrochromogenes]
MGEIVRRLRPGGLVVLDNVFLGGRVLDPAYREEPTWRCAARTT